MLAVPLHVLSAHATRLDRW